MATGPGVYDDLTTYVREQAQADGVVVIVLNGNKGSGFSCQGTAWALAQVPGMLREIVPQIESDFGFKAY